MSQISRDDVLQLIPAYVLGILDADERQQVDQLLTTDDEAQTLLQQYRQIETVLPLLATQAQPSPDLRDRLIQQSRIDRGFFNTPDNITPMKPKRKRKPLSRRVVLPLVAGLVLVIVGLIFVLTTQTEPPSAQKVFYALNSLTDTERVTIPASEDSLAEGDLVISPDGEQAVLRLRQLPEIGVDQAFQLWMVDENGAIDGGVFPPPISESNLYMVIPNEKPIRGYIRFGVSIEPATGSPLGNKPTGDRVIQVIVPQEQ